MNDVAPILLESVQKCFDKWFYTDREVKEIYKKVRKGTATFKEMKRFSERAGAILVESLKATFSADKLPDGKLYQNIAEKVITPMLEQNHGLINEVCGYVADDLNRAARIGTKAVTAVFNADKAETVAQIAANCGEVVPGNKAAQLVENATMSMVDDFIQANLEFQKKLGLVPQIQRIYHGGKNRCEFCASLQYTGEYNGPGMPSEIFRRHRDCRCTLIYKPQKGPYQDPWSKAEKDDYQKLVTEQRKYLTELDKMSAGERRIERNAKARAQRRTLYGPAEWNSRKAQQIIIADNRASGKEYRAITQGKMLQEKALQETKRKTLDSTIIEEYNNSPAKNELRKRYLKDVEDGWISPLSGFDNYYNLYQEIETKIVGTTTRAGTTISGQSRHFLQRVIGTSKNPSEISNGVYKITNKKQKYRSISRGGVEILNVIEAIEKGRIAPPEFKNGEWSQIYKGTNCAVSINPKTGNLIQCNPRKTGEE